MAKPPSQTLPPHEGEGLGLGVKVVYSSDWYNTVRAMPDAGEWFGHYEKTIRGL